MARLWVPLLAVTFVSHAQHLPAPEKGEYACTQLNLAPALPLPGLIPSTTVTAAPGPYGNLVLDGAGKYHMTVGDKHSGSYRYDRATGRVTFDGPLAAIPATYGANGSLLYFTFRSEGISFTCSARGKADSGTRDSSRPQTRHEEAAPNSRFTGRVYYAEPSGAFRIDLRTGHTTALGLSGNFDIRKDGAVVYVNSRGDMILSHEDGSGASRIPVYGAKNYSPRFAPDGGRIAYYGGQKPSGLEAAMEAAFTNNHLEPLVVSQQGRVLAAFGADYAQPCWTPDGRIVVAGARSVPGILAGNVIGIFISDPALRRLTRLPLNFDSPHSPAVSPDGSKLAFANGPNLWVSGIDGSSPRKVYDGASSHVMFPAWSPDGQSLVFVDNQVVGIVSLKGEELPVKAHDGRTLRSTSELVWLP
jgi:hypothetical protein